uniref:Cyp10 n=1 Tax=Arundo donax TaxID=35708 RepID=A0A0A8ZDA4_ARUDO
MDRHARWMFGLKCRT